MHTETEARKKKPLPEQFYANCPVCGTTLIKAKNVDGAVIKCLGCKRLMVVEIKKGRIVVVPQEIVNPNPGENTAESTEIHKN